jgi:uncharacterized protein
MQATKKKPLPPANAPPTIEVAAGLYLPLDAVTQTTAIIAKKGAGKTYTAKVLAEGMLEAGQQVAYLDPTGVCWGLRSSADGERPGYPVLIFGGLHADLPLEHTAGEVIARFVRESGQSVILDLSEFSNNQMQRFVADFAEGIYHNPSRSPIHLFADEADMFAPQNPMDGDKRMLGAIDKIVRRGRVKGLGFTMITQRPAAINKNVLTQIELLICLRVMSPQDRAAVKLWVDAHGTPEQSREMMESLPTLGQGEAWFWSPEWLGIFERHKVRPLRTFDSSATPAVGEAVIEPKALAELDLESLKGAIAETVEQKKANDPVELKKRIAALELQISQGQPGGASPEEVEAAVRGATEELERQILVNVSATLSQIFRTITEGHRAITDEIRRLALDQAGVKDPLDSFQVEKTPGVVLPDIPRTPRSLIQRVEVELDPESAAALERSKEAANGQKRNLPLRILDTLRDFEAIGLAEVPKDYVAMFAGSRPSSSTFSIALASARRDGFLRSGSKPGTVTLTKEGRLRAIKKVDALTLADLHRRWLETFPEGITRRIVSSLIKAHPKAVAKPDLATLADTTVTSSSYTVALGKLRRLGLVEYTDQGSVYATPLLFPEGLK